MFTVFYKHHFVFIFPFAYPLSTTLLNLKYKQHDVNKNISNILTSHIFNCIFAPMKTKLHFTRGEWAAALFLLSVIIASNIYYFWHENRQKPSLDFSLYGAQFQQFAEEQQRLADSIEATRWQTFGNRPHVRSDTLPPFQKQERKPLYDIVMVDLNSCDTNDLVTIPQFGSKRAAKLVEYREKLGGFYNYAQLQEIYIMQNIDTVKLKTYLYINKQKIKKLNINTATYQELVSHPYIDSYLTKLIIKHREKNGPIRDMDELQRITHAYPELIEKLKPYLAF